MEDKDFYISAAKGFKLIGSSCMSLAVLFFLFKYDINEIDYIDLFLCGSFIFVCGNLLLEK